MGNLRDDQITLEDVKRDVDNINLRLTDMIEKTHDETGALSRVLEDSRRLLNTIETEQPRLARPS